MNDRPADSTPRKLLTTRKLIALGLLVFLCGLVVRFPANAALAWFAPEKMAVSIGTARGTIWSGSMYEVRYRKLVIPRIDWEVAPTALLTGSVRASLRARLPDGELQAVVAQSIGGNTQITGLKGSTDLTLASQLGLMPPGFASGEILVNFPRIELEDGKPVGIEGRGALTGLRNSLMPNVALGDYEADLSTSERGIVGNFRDLQGPLEITGSAVLSMDGNYTVSAMLRSRPDAPDALKESLKFLGPENTEGRRQLDMEGRL